MPNNNEQIVVKPSKWKSFKDTYFLTGAKNEALQVKKR